jgi:quercetin dioxygenase-like cupin family protein
MKIVNYADIPANALGLPGAKDVTIRLLIGPDEAPNFVMMLLELAAGGNTPDHSHEWEEEIFVKSGRGVIKAADGEKPIRAGDVLFFERNESHQFINTGAEPLEFLCVIPRRA